MRVDLFDFELPDERIALRPAVPRDASRLLVVDNAGALTQAHMTDLPRLLREGDVLVVNDTKVFPARLRGVREPRAGAESGANIEALLCRRLSENSYRALTRPAKRLRPGDHVRFGPSLNARVTKRDGGEADLVFDQSGPMLDAAVALAGEMPLPPYIAGKRKADARDTLDYQTVYAAEAGAVAAPTAGLHFTRQLLEQLKEAGVSRETITLHVGVGTFLPVTADTTEQHIMHGEWARLSAETAARLNDVRKVGGRIIAVGSTALRTLETASDEDGVLHAFEGETDLFISPGYRFKCIDAMVTNFHLPRSTLFMLVCALCGIETMTNAYKTAIAMEYRFYSYGDACLLFPSNEAKARS